ncbi:DUF917 domain-containing protein [Fervidicoccus fontis]|jgi:DUF917 family protein|uniref:DUF917 domain-containing protein n=1 Tax=Fervidicoccus fontis TaxID=683846 RepID=A0A7C2ZQ39_9CREN|nr:DUF917 domain-containing protein [Fervidicoccus fontis]PMB76282.1 MAG: hypothetical protein C0177_06950 [Fervidicoccus fontis]HEW63532.1 DUF917 domain-containing protein [Fervidicoccus fontis]
MKVLSGEYLENIVWGATLLGSGGGGSSENGLQLVKEIKKLGKSIKLLELEDIKENYHIATVAGMGAPLALKEKGFNKEALYAFEALEKLYNLAGIKIDAIMPVETGGFNSLVPFYVAAYKDLPIADFDGAGGRAVPELGTLLYRLYKIPSSPLTLANKRGDTIAIWLEDPLDAKTGEEISRHITVAFEMLSGIAGWVITGWQAKNYMNPKSLSNTIEVGKAIEDAKNAGKDPVKAAVDILKGYELFRGTITSIDVKTMEGFDFGRTTLEGMGNYSGKKFYIDFKNENMIAWKRENEPAAMAPDLICLITLDGTPVTNADIKIGMKIAAIGFASGKKWRDAPNFFEAWKPILTKMGYKGEYIPIEKLVE